MRFLPVRKAVDDKKRRLTKVMRGVSGGSPRETSGGAETIAAGAQKKTGPQARKFWRLKSPFLLNKQAFAEPELA
jgi:hypothetical protein